MMGRHELGYAQARMSGALRRPPRGRGRGSTCTAAAISGTYSKRPAPRGCIVEGREGSLTQLPILTMPAGDISHPIPDLSGYITEGQIVLDRDIDRRDVYPPVNVLPSLSRLMKDGIGEGYTEPDHPALAQQLYAAYARADQVRRLARVVGAEGLPRLDREFLSFGDRFEGELIHQTQPRTLEQSMEIGWSLLKMLPVGELDRLSDEQLERHLGGPEAELEPEEPREAS